jgi:putative ABC transport system substrate-binding protein
MPPRSALAVILAVGAIGMPLRAPAQPAGKVYRIGVFASGANPRSAPFYQAFEQRLRDLGWAEGKNLVIEFQMPKGPRDLDFATVAADLVRRNVDVILAGGPEASLRAARQATSAIPIVMVALNYNPVAKGYVASLAHPGGNVTGVFSQAPEQAAKQLELLREALPNVTVVGVLSEAFARDQVAALARTASQLHLQLVRLEVPPPYDYERAFLALKRRPVGAVLIVGSPIFFRDRARIAEIALRHRIPAGGFATGAEAGLLLGFGVNPSVPYRLAADYVDRLLRGARPADLPIEQPTQYELAVNLKTFKALGLTIPPSVLARADRVIE